MNNTWISFSIYHTEINNLLCHILPEIKTRLESTKSKFIFTRNWERGEHLLLLFNTDQPEMERYIKMQIDHVTNEFFKKNPAPEKVVEFPVNNWFLPFPNNHLEYRNNFLFDVMETGGVQAAKNAENIFTVSSEIIGEVIVETGEWSSGNAFVPALQLNLILSGVFSSNLQTLKEFYTYLFDHALKSSSLNDDADAQKSLLEEFEGSFQEQKEGIVDFVNYVYETVSEGESFDEEWLNVWLNASRKVKNEITALQSSGKLITPEGFEDDLSLTTSVDTQRQWPILMYYIRFMNTQIDNTGVYELNLIYTIKRSIETILEN